MAVNTPTSFFNASSTSSISLFPLISPHTHNNHNHNYTTTHQSYSSNLKQNSCYLHHILKKNSDFCYTKHTICRASEYQFPDPIPEFAASETEKFKDHLMNKLSKKARYGDELDEVVGICTEIFGKFMHEEYGGPGTLLVLPFAVMAEAVTESGLTGGPQAARAAVKWAQANVDKDWKEWTSGNHSKEP